MSNTLCGYARQRKSAPRRPIWRAVALFLAGLGMGFQGLAFGMLVPITFVQGGFGGYFTVFGLRVNGVPGGLEVAGVFFSAALVLSVLMPLGIASIAATSLRSFANACCRWRPWRRRGSSRSRP